MVPTGLAEGPHLAAVLPSSLAAMRGETNDLRLPPLRSLIVVVVDGLGTADLRTHRGYARRLAEAMGSRSTTRTGGPTTTASALTSLTTGTVPGQHGMVGYSVLDPTSDRVVNQLSGWGTGSVDPLTWQRKPTLFETSDVRSVVVASPRYSESGFTQAVLRGAQYRGVADVAERFRVAVDLVNESEPTLVYLYVPELDMAAHSSGTDGARWLAALEDLDAAVATAVPRLGRGAGMILTADHGMVTATAESRIVIPDSSELLDGVRHVAGEPRVLHLHLEPTEDRAESRVRADALAELWRRTQQRRAWVMTRAEAIGAGIFGDVDPEVAPRIGDVVVAARSNWVYYEERTAATSAFAMVGQHGSFTAEEREIPMLRFGAARPS